jgi:predicted membrane protein
MNMNNNYFGRILIGLFMIFFGVSFLLGQFNIGFSLLRFWPVIIIVVGIYLLTKKSNAVGLIMLVLGVLFLASSFFDISVFGLLWPLILIAVGASILFKPKFMTNINDTGTISEETINATAIFGGVSKKVISKSFKGGSVTYAFGGFTIDLRHAVIAEGAEIVLDGAFGGGEVYVPTNVAVISDGSAIFGAWENKSEVPENPVATITIRGAVVFGGVEIKNS